MYYLYNSKTEITLYADDTVLYTGVKDVYASSAEHCMNCTNGVVSID